MWCFVKFCFTGDSFTLYIWHLTLTDRHIVVGSLSASESGIHAQLHMPCLYWLLLNLYCLYHCKCSVKSTCTSLSQVLSQRRWHKIARGKGDKNKQGPEEKQKTLPMFLNHSHWPKAWSMLYTCTSTIKSTEKHNKHLRYIDYIIIYHACIICKLAWICFLDYYCM